MSDDDMLRRGDVLVAVPSGWTGKPHQSNMDYGPNTSAKALSAIAALPAVQPDVAAIREAAEADDARLREERDAILSDSIIHSDQREKYERLCARIAAGKASQQDAVDAIRQLCRDNERLALRLSDARAAMTGQQP